VAAFYLSNVEGYLVRDRIWSRFCSNVATLPLASNADFIRWRYLQPQPETPPPSPGSRVAVSARVVVEPGADWKKFRADVKFSEGPWELMTLEEANRLLPAGPPDINFLVDARAATANCGTDSVQRRGHD
jgi:hypothetical protein